MRIVEMTINRKNLGTGVCLVSAVVGILVNKFDNNNSKKPLLYSSEAMEHLTGKWEGCRTKAYKDTGGLLTNGIGHLCTKIQDKGDLTLDQVADLFYDDLYSAEQCVLQNFNGKELTQGQREALTDFVFNVGCGKASVNTNGYLTKIRTYALTGQSNLLCDEFLKWSFGRNIKGELIRIQGLYNRRTDERKWCLK